MNILIIRYSSLGDVVISTAVLKAIRDRYPDAEIDFLTDIRYSPVLNRNPFVNRVITLNRNELRLYESIRLEKELRQYDILFDLQNKLFSRIIALRKSRGEVHIFNKSSYGNIANQEANILELYSNYLNNCGIEMREKRYFLFYERRRRWDIIGINIEGGHISKRLTRRQIYSIVSELSQKGFKILLIGTELSSELAREISCRFKNIIDTTSSTVDALIDRIATLSVLITPDSGPLHIAAALNVPTVAIFSSTSHDRWLPRSDRISLIKSDYTCAPCSEYGTAICRAMKSFGCISTISPDIILFEAMRLYESYKEED
ncbi:MAG: glycosyltransferase family 9 protein [Myxococcota bacterium]